MSHSYLPRRPALSVTVPVRGLSYHCHVWGDRSLAQADRPSLVLAHGWMDVAASYQFMVDALAEDRHVIALDWRGFGLSGVPQPTDAYWFPDYLGDLDALLRAPELGLSDEPEVDLCGHSMGGNVAMMYAGVRPQRIRRLVNLEGFGLPERRPQDAGRQYAKWLDELREPARMRTYGDPGEVAQRLMQNNPRLGQAQATWLAPHWSRPDADGRWHILGDPAHKRVNPVLYRAEEVVSIWRQITAPTLWVEGQQTDVTKWWGTRYPREEFEQRLQAVLQLSRVMLEDCGHMLHHDQPQALAAAVEAFLDA